MTEARQALQELCRVHGQAEIARRAGMSRQSVHQALKGKRPPSAKLLAAIGFEVKVQPAGES